MVNSRRIDSGRLEICEMAAVTAKSPPPKTILPSMRSDWMAASLSVPPRAATCFATI